MSLILDALRKAERERELGQVPTIGSQLPLRRRPEADRRGPWIAAMAATYSGRVTAIQANSAGTKGSSANGATANRKVGGYGQL